jgi:hypothetical protein
MGQVGFAQKKIFGRHPVCAAGTRHLRLPQPRERASMAAILSTLDSFEPRANQRSGKARFRQALAWGCRVG